MLRCKSCISWQGLFTKNMSGGTPEINCRKGKDTDKKDSTINKNNLKYKHKKSKSIMSLFYL